jgi:type II secretory pathway component PulK
VITLFVVALVTVLVLEYHFDAAVELDLATNYASDVQAYHLALAGVRFAHALLQRDDPKADGPDDAWYRLGLVPACFAPQQLVELATAMGGESPTAAGLEAPASALSERPREEVSQGNGGCVSLRISDEDSKLPINALMPPPGDENSRPPAVWERIFQAFFASFKIDPEVVDALVDWIDLGDTPRGSGGAEYAHYQRLPVPYKPPNSRMRTPGELRLVKGLEHPEELAKLFPGITPEAVADLDLSSNIYVTPFGSEQPQQSRVNLNTATPEVLTALIDGVQQSGSSRTRQSSSAAEAIVQDIVARRQAKQFKTLSEAVAGANLGPGLNQVADVKSTFFRVESVGVVGVVHKKIVAVLRRAPQVANQPNTTVANMLYFKVE